MRARKFPPGVDGVALGPRFEDPKANNVCSADRTRKKLKPLLRHRSNIQEEMVVEPTRRPCSNHTPQSAAKAAASAALDTTKSNRTTIPIQYSIPNWMFRFGIADRSSSRSRRSLPSE